MEHYSDWTHLSISCTYIRYPCNVQYKPPSLLLQYEWNLETAGCLFYQTQLCLSSESPTLFHGPGCKHRNTGGSLTGTANLDGAPAPSSNCGKILQWFWHSEYRASWYILIMKANEMHNFSYLFDKVLYMFQTCPLSIIRSISTLYTRSRCLSCQSASRRQQN